MLNYFEDLDFTSEHEIVQEELNSYYTKHELLHEMIREFFDKGDFESETVKYLIQKKDVINGRIDTLRDVRDHLGNLEDGAPFHVKRRIGRCM